MKAGKKRKPAIPNLQKYRMLKRMYPHLENHELWRLAGRDSQGAHPLWAQHGQALHPVVYRAWRRRGRQSY